MTYKYFPYYFIAFFALLIFCFYQSYFGEFPDFKDVISPIGNVAITITTVTHFHAIMIVLWMCMLVAQPILIIKKQIKWHRIIGKVSYVLVTLMFLSILMIIHQHQIREKSLPVLASHLLDVPSFIAMYLFAIYFRKKSAYHSRFMIMSTIPFLSPGLARLNLPGIYIGMVLWIVFLIIEFFNKKIYKPYLIGLGFYLVNFAIAAYLMFANQPLLDRIWGVFWG